MRLVPAADGAGALASRSAWRPRRGLAPVLALALHGAAGAWLLATSLRAPEPDVPFIAAQIIAPAPMPTPARPEPVAARPVPRPERTDASRPSTPKAVARSAENVPAVIATRGVDETASQTVAAPEPAPPAVATAATAAPAASTPAAPAAPTPTAPAAPGAAVAARSTEDTPVVAPRFDADYLDNPAPAYPHRARIAREQGVVTLHVLVGADGRAQELRVHRGSGSQRLDEAALEAVRRWKFVPARRGAETVAAPVLVPIRFTLKESS